MTIKELLDTVLPRPSGCCGNRRWELQRLALEEWIKAHKGLSDEEVIIKLRRML